MKLRPTQVVGLVAIVVFGGILVTTLLKGKRDPDLLPSGVRLSDLPSLPAPDPQFPPLDLSAPQPPAVSANGASTNAFSYPGAPDYLNLGSQDAKDDMYCAGVISAEFDARPDQHPDEMSKQIAAQTSLDDAGTEKLIAEGAATRETGAGFTLAYSAKAHADHAANALRIPFDACMARAAALPQRN